MYKWSIENADIEVHGVFNEDDDSVNISAEQFFSELFNDLGENELLKIESLVMKETPPAGPW